jgi:hypothetical protein
MPSPMQKIIIILIILCFIPIAIFAYLPKPITLPASIDAAYH